MNKTVFSLICISGLIAACGRAPIENLSVTQVDAMINVLPETEVVTPVDDTLRAARGENATVQFVIDTPEELKGLSGSIKMQTSGKSAKALEKASTFGWVHYVRSDHHYRPAPDDSLKSATGLYPDPIITDRDEDVPAGGRAVLWADIPVAVDCEDGDYRAMVTIHGTDAGGKSICIRKPLNIKVYPAKVESQSLYVTNWIFPGKMAFMNGGKQPEYGSPEFWKCFGAIVETANDYGQNTWIIYEKPEAVLDAEGGLSFDYTRFDEEIEFLIQRVNVRCIEGGPIGKRSNGGWTDPIWAPVYVPDGNGGIEEKLLPPDDPETAEYLSLYFKSLLSHLKSKALPDGRSWADIYVQHIGDEPLDENLASWETLAGIAKAAAPELRIIEAYQASHFNADLIDVIVPQLDKLGFDCYDNIPDSTELWFYTCTWPRGNYANRFVTMPLMKARLLQWINFRYGATGFLHWGLNHWGANGDPWIDVSSPANDWAGGDAYIIYPGEGKVYPSIRLAALREGIRDYELLRTVSSIDGEAADRLVRELILDYDRYDTSVEKFREVRKELLSLASQAEK